MDQVIWIDFSLEQSLSSTVLEQQCPISVSVSKLNGIIKYVPTLFTFEISEQLAINSCAGTHDVQDTTYNIQDEPITVTIDYIKNTEALGTLLALMYLDQAGNIVCNHSIYAAIRRSEDDFTLGLPMGDPAMTNNSYMGLAYDIERDGLENEAYPAVRRHVDIGEYIIGVLGLNRLFFEVIIRKDEKTLFSSRCDAKIKW